ncbi:MAG: N-6 DNA methylase [Microscillaceae bacterium]|jgi:hypothetical protein|nr:N-6 DNA methylase [Microscillaceae bacterium]
MTNKKQALIKIKILIEKFKKGYTSYKLPQYKEDRLRIDFIDPFWEALGWDVKNEKELPETYREVIYEDRVVFRTDDNVTTKEPDYAFTVNGERKFFVEVKKPSVVIHDDPKPAIQVRLYGWNANLGISLVSDFEELAIYDCNKKPKKYDRAGDSRIEYLKYDTDYENRFDFIWDTFSREAVFKGSLDKYAKIDKKGSETVDTEFLKQMNQWRKLLADGIAHKNPKLTEEEIRFAVQMLLDRVIFLRICEDREIETYKTLFNIAHETDHIHSQIFAYFKTAASKYNSGLFEFKIKDTLTETLQVPDQTWQIVIKDMYFPESPFLFKIIPADILGNVYEQFLGKQIILKGRLSREIEIDYKPEVRKAGGVYYTPQYIVRYIVENTLGKLLEGKTPTEVDKLKIVDPSCGSGSFLIQAYQYLLNWYQDYYYKLYKKQAQARLGEKNAAKTNKAQITNFDLILTPDGKLTTAEKKRILLNSIYGVDIDEQAVEVTKLNLLLKALEGETNASIETQVKIRREKVLADLDKNIKVGNSLIGKDYKDKSVKPFDWETAFVEVFRQGGFDCVIGNPPYRTLQLGKKQESTDKIILDYFQKKYINSFEYKVNLYALFIEKMLEVVRNTGFFSFIVPNSLYNAFTFKKLRKHLLEKGVFNILMDLRYKVFGDAEIGGNAVFIYTKNKDINNSEMASESLIITINTAEEFENPIVFKVNHQNFYQAPNYNLNFEIKSNTILDKIKKVNTIELGKITKIYQGIITGDNKNFLSNVVQNNKWQPILRGRDVNRYNIEFDNTYIYYEPSKLWSNTNIEMFKVKEKIISRQTSDRLVASLDVEEYFSLDSTHVIHLKENIFDIKYLLGIYNSTLLNFIYQSSVKEIGRVFAQVKVINLKPLPIKLIDLKNKAEKKLHDQIVELVAEMLELQKAVRQVGLLPNKRAELEDDIRYTDNQIDKLVYQLYELTPEEIKLVEG